MPTRSPWQIRGDLHVHAQHTICDSHKSGDPVEYGQTCGVGAIEEMRSYLSKREYEYLAIVNHATNPLAPEPPTASSEKLVREHKDIIERVRNEAGPTGPVLLAGVEASLLASGDVDVTKETLCSLSVVIASRHGNSTEWRMDETLRRLQHLFVHCPVNILGHPTRYVVPATLPQYRQLLQLCTEFEIAFELNLRNPFGAELITSIVRSGVLISLGSDIHGNMIREQTIASGSLSSIPVIRQLQQQRFPASRVINTWPLERLLRWLEERRIMCHT
ncbi:MAG: hypothetical protein HY567_02090 [Candidatus Kerfeldbacteria bacterium]|nr:hypothetical protein [Candidatus Kerfeldbacteria bacterium]